MPTYLSKNNLLSFERMSLTQDASGQQLQTWTKIGECWASIKTVLGREYFVASGEKASISHQIETSYQPSLDLTPRDRINFHKRYFNIHSVLNKNEQNRDWIIMCSEVINTDG